MSKMSKKYVLKSAPRKPHSIPVLATKIAIGTIVTGFIVEFLPNTYFLRKYKKIVQAYHNAEPYPLKPRVKKLWDEVMKDLKFDEEKISFLQPFVVNRMEMFHAGMKWSKYGAIIGIPISYSYRDKYSFDLYQIKLNDNDFNEHHPAADDLLEALLLSDKAKKYGIAREVLMSDKDLPLFNCLINPLCIALTIAAGEALRLRFNLHTRHKVLQFIVYGTTAFAGFALWSLMKDSLHTYYERVVDKEIAALGADYVEGGREYYEKLMKVHVALRVLLGRVGANAYDENGDYKYLMRQKKVPPSERKKFFDTVDLNVGQEQKQVA